jgi:hypothetical protein
LVLTPTQPSSVGSMDGISQLRGGVVIGGLPDSR